jgi:surfeit locus 1 family protein
MKKTGIYFTIRWILTTVLVLSAAGVMVRLGFWQLDRLAQRRAFNARLINQMNSPAIDLNQNFLIDQIHSMEYRDALVTGAYSLGEQVLLRNQVWNGNTGYRIVTPLKIDGQPYSVLVDRGWIPYDQAGNLNQFDENGKVTVQGQIRQSQASAGFGGAAEPTYAAGQKPLEAINSVNIPRIQQQTQDKLLPVYIQQAPDPAWTRLPQRSLADVQIDEGPHLGYAIQWFTFATVLGAGYPFFIRRKLRQPVKNETVENRAAVANVNQSLETWPHEELDQELVEIHPNHPGERK